MTSPEPERGDDAAAGRSPRELPSVSVLLGREALRSWIERGRPAVVDAIRAALDESRFALVQGRPADVSIDGLVRSVLGRLESATAGLRPVLNATGILLHTGLGRAPLARAAVDAVAAVAGGYSNLEFDLETGRRGRRTSAVAEWLRRLTGAPAATVVNNNAAATVLALRSLAMGREVIVSRGQLVEIGGSFRLPEIFEVSGARLREVGTTNRTRLADYERAIGPDTAAILRVHAANYRIIGFTEEVPIAALGELARRSGITLIDDIGSGAIAPGLPPGIAREPTIAAGLSAGADLVLCSADKLLGGPQAGLIVGKAAAVERASADPLMRAFRVDKMTLAALETTLRLAVQSPLEIPTWAFLNQPIADQQARAERFAESLRNDLGLDASVEPSTAFLGGGSLPEEGVPSFVVRLRPPYPGSARSETDLARRLRIGRPPVVARTRDGSVLLDLRAIVPDDEGPLAGAIAAALTLPPANLSEE